MIELLLFRYLVMRALRLNLFGSFQEQAGFSNYRTMSVLRVGALVSFATD